MARKNEEFTYEVNEGFNFVLEEGQNSSICLRKISWNGRPEKIDIRKYTYTEGEEKMLKGVSMSDDAADELATVLVENGYGDTRRIAKAISTREYEAIDEEVDDGSEDDEYYDPSELLG